MNSIIQKFRLFQNELSIIFGPGGGGGRPKSNDGKTIQKPSVSKKASDN